MPLRLDSPTARMHNVSDKTMTGSYNYRVRACHTNTACTDWSSPLTTAHVFISPAPANLRSNEPTTSGDGAYTLTWERVSGAAARYELQEGQEGDSESFTTIYSEDGFAHPISNKTDGSYSYQVRACHTNGACGPWSEPLSVLVYIDCTARTSPQSSSNGFNDGDGTKGDPYLICTYAQLRKMGENSADSRILDQTLQAWC